MAGDAAAGARRWGPPSRYRPASRSSVSVSLTLVASPSSTRSMPSSLTEIVHAGFAARLRAFRVPAPLVKYSSPSSQTAPTPAACGRPSGRDVPRKNVISGPGGPVSWADADPA
jgi:hypothetical protein